MAKTVHISLSMWRKQCILKTDLDYEALGLEAVFGEKVLLYLIGSPEPLAILVIYLLLDSRMSAAIETRRQPYNIAPVVPT